MAKIIDLIFLREHQRSAQRQAPLRQEREQYLSQMLDQGTRRYAIRSAGTMLLHVIRLMDLTCLRTVSISEIEDAGQRWISDPGIYKSRRPGCTSAHTFTYFAVRFFKFHHSMQHPIASISPNETMFKDFRHYLREARGMRPETLRNYGYRLKAFLMTFENSQERIPTITLRDVDDFLQKKRDAGYSPHTITSFAWLFGPFFSIAEMRG